MGQVRGNRPGGLKTRLRSVTHCSLGSATAGWHGQIESVGFLPASGMGHMELRHPRCFLAVAEELHFARAVERRHIEQSPLSRAIKELEEDLGVRPFIHNSRSTRLSRAGQVFKERISRIVTGLQQAREGAKAVAARYDGNLRVAAGAALADLAAFFALCTQSCNACLGSPIRAATSTTVKPRLMTCLTASALNPAVYCLLLINTPVDAINYGHRDV